MIGADICFWDDMVNPLENLVGRAMDMGVKLVLFSDPGRLPFDKFGEDLVKNMPGGMWNHTLWHPYSFEGEVLKRGRLFNLLKSIPLLHRLVFSFVGP